MPKQIWVKIFSHCKLNGDSYSYLLPTVEFCYLRIGFKMLSLGLIDDALHLAFSLNNKQLVGAASKFAKKKRNVLLMNLIDYHEEKDDPHH